MIIDNGTSQKNTNMKRNFTLLLATLTFGAFAQEPIEVRDGSVVFEGGTYASYSVTIHETDENFVEKLWKEQIKSSSDKVTTKKEWFIDNARISSIDQDTLDIYSKVVKLGKTGNVDFIVAFNAHGTFIGPEDEKRHAAAMKYVYDFAFRTSKQIVNEQLEEAENALEKSKKDLEGLEKEKARLESSIEKNNQKISKAEGKIEQNGKDHDKLKSDIEVKRSMVGSSSDEKDAKELQKLLSEQSNLERDTDKQNSTIRSSKKKIEDAEYDLKKNETNIEEKKLEIEENTKKLDEVRAKLMNIK